MPTHFLFVASVLLLTTACDAYLAGDNSYGQLGVADPTASSGTVDVGSKWVTLEAGYRHTCGITINATLWCWGHNTKGEVGNGTTGTSDEPPTQVGTATDWQKIAPGGKHTCGIRAGEMWCWGNDTFGQLGNGNTTTGNQGSPVRVGTFTDWIAANSGNFHTCGIRNDAGDKKLYCWGLNSTGQLGIGTTTNSTIPQRIFGIDGSQWKQVSAGFNHTCSLNEADSIYCWGSNSHGQLGTESYALGSVWDHPFYPVANFQGILWQSVSAGGDFSCAIVKATQSDPIPNTLLICWGSNEDHQITSGGDPLYRVPLLLGQGFIYCDGSGIPCAWNTNYFSSVSAGISHQCAIQSGSYASGLLVEEYSDEKGVECMGSNEDGQLDIKNTLTLLDSSSAQPISVSAGLQHSVLLVYEQ